MRFCYYSDTDVEGMDENETLLSDILNFIKAIALREFRASGPQHYQHFEDILTLLKELEAKEADQHGNAYPWLGSIGGSL